MVEIDLTPVAIRTVRTGKTRFMSLCAMTLGPTVAACACAVVVESLPVDDATTLEIVRGEVVQLENRMQKHIDDRAIAQRIREQSLTRTLQRVLVSTVLEIVATGSHTGVSLSKLHIAQAETTIEGGGLDAPAVSRFLEGMMQRCPSMKTVIDRVHTRPVFGTPVEWFSVRLSFSPELEGVSLCRKGVSDES